jgi:hypothetical protein
MGPDECPFCGGEDVACVSPAFLVYRCYDCDETWNEDDADDGWTPSGSQRQRLRDDD